ncbi:MAG: hypothetical protein NZ483_05895 [Verrucomicrobiae bacterium]|nr:hypothetical protein [Verrucomicrobiae bacterium]
MQKNLGAGIEIPFRLSKAPHPDLQGKVVGYEKANRLFTVISPTGLGNGQQYKGGTLNVAGVKFVVRRIHHPLSIEVEDDVPLPFVLQDDDDNTVLANQRTPDVGELAPALAEAFVAPVYDLANPNPVAPFRANIMGVFDPDFGQLFLQRWDSRGLNANDYWVAYVQSGFQYETMADNDPGLVLLAGSTAEGAVLGTTLMLGLGGCMVYLEVIRPAEGFPAAAEKERDTVVHEIGHVITGSGQEPVTWGNGRYRPDYLRMIRQAVRPLP